MGFAALLKVIEEQQKLIQEAVIDLSLDLYQLLSSVREEANIAEVVRIEMPNIVYNFEEKKTKNKMITSSAYYHVMNLAVCS